MHGPSDIVQRVARLVEFHESTKLRDGLAPPQPDAHLRPAPYRIFDAHPKVALPTHLIGVDVVATVSLLGRNPEAVPDSELNPPHDLRTLATWLYMAYGLTHQSADPEHGGQWLHSCPSAGAAVPCEIYVAALAVEGLEPGLYHFGAREFALRKLRDGGETFGALMRAAGGHRPLRAAPAIILVSTNFWRSAWRFGDRGYRAALLDAGHLVENLALCAAGLGMQTLVRLDAQEEFARELIGVESAADFGMLESVQAIVAWTDPAERPFVPASAAPAGRLPPIPRAPLSREAKPHDAIRRAHAACVAPGGLAAEIRPPLTDLSPLPEQIQAYERPPADDPHGGTGLSSLMTHRHSARAFHRAAVSRDHLLWINQLALRGAGTYPPLLPSGNHAALVRPFWLVNAARGLDAGIWFYDVPTDKWAELGRGEARMEAAYLALDQGFAGDAAAVCFVAANLELLMQSAGPDLYRLAHLEAGIVNHRIQLAAEALGLGACGIVQFLDDEVRRFLGLERTRWQVLYATAVGMPLDAEHPQPPAEQSQRADDSEEESDWRD